MASEIERLREWEDGDSCYRTSCECMGDDQLTFMINVDKESGVVFLELYADTYHDGAVWDDPRWSRGIRGFWQRIKSCWTLLIHGHLKYHAGFIFRGENHINEFCDTIQEAKNRGLKVWEERRNGKS